MKLKYFMRGLGAGILFTTIILMVSFNTSGFNKMSEDDIIEEAKTLGMVYADTKEVDLSALNSQKANNENETTENDELDHAASEETNEDPSKENPDTAANKENIEAVSTENKEISKEENLKTEDKETAKTEDTKTEDKETTKTEDKEVTKSDVTSTKNTENNITDKSTSEKADSEGSDSITIEIKPGMYASSVASLLVKKGIIDNEKAIIDYLENKDWLLDIKTGKHKIPKETTIKEIAEIITNH